MSKMIRHREPTHLSPEIEQQPVSKPVMALDALSKLTRQFADNPDFYHLIEILMLTLSGQFSVPSSFITVRNPLSQTEPTIAFSTGRFRTHPTIGAVSRVAVQDTFFQRHPRPSHVDDLLTGESQSLSTTLMRLAEAGVVLVAPLLHNHRLIGILGLGPKASGKPFEQDEIGLLTTITNTVTPLIANSFLFMEISQLNTWYLEILDNVKQGVFVFDSNFLLRKANAAGLQILQHFCGDDITYKSVEALPLHHLFTEEAFPNWGRRLMKGQSEKQGALIENLVARKPGEEAIFNVRLSRIRRETGVRSDIIVSVDDITDQKESDQRLFELQKFAEKGVMASSIAHELNNFLGLVLGGVELTELAIQRNLTEKANASIERLKGSVQQMKRFTAGLMDYGRHDAEKKLVNLNTVVSDVLSFVRVQKKFKRIEIRTEFDQNLALFHMDADQMAQLLLNLVNNAADAIADAEREVGWITVQTIAGPDHSRLVVADNGTGMSEEVRSKLFRSRLTTKTGGHGYGLVTCARIVANHEGRVEIDSEPGQGSTFTFEFPHISD